MSVLEPRRVHPAHAMPFDALLAGLRAAGDAELVHERPGPDGLVLFVYSRRCLHDGAWTPVTLAARGLVLDPGERRIAATPFPKFFNVGERDAPTPPASAPFVAQEKLDGSLVIAFRHRGRWLAVTKGDWSSEAAIRTQAVLDAGAPELDAHLAPGVTYLLEATGPENRIVVRYEESALTLLGEYGPHGREVPDGDLDATAVSLGWRRPVVWPFGSVDDALAEAGTLTQAREGYVLRFADGLRLKVKGDEYRRLHALLDGVTPLGVWEVLTKGDDPAGIRADLPEELWDDFDRILALLRRDLDRLVADVGASGEALAPLSDRQLGLSMSERVRPFLFPYRRAGGDLLRPGRARDALLRAVRPTGDRLAGYEPSARLRHVREEAGT